MDWWWSSFFAPAFLQFSAGYTDLPTEADGYVYLYATDEGARPSTCSTPWNVQKPSGISLMRAPATSALETMSNWEYFDGMSGDTPQWTSTIGDREPVWYDSNGAMRIQVNYNKGLERYFLLVQQNDRMKACDAYLGIYESEHPWGPWSKVFYDDVFTHTPSFMTGSHVKSVMFGFSNKWTSVDGKDTVMIYTDADEYAQVPVTFTTETSGNYLYVCDNQTQCNAGDGSGWGEPIDQAGNGTMANPWKTLAYAMDRANPSDTIILGDSTSYARAPESSLGMWDMGASRSGTDGNYITIRAEHAGLAEIDGTDVGIDGLGDPHVAFNFVEGGAYVKFEGLYIHNFMSAFTFRAANSTDYTKNNRYVEIRNCKITDCYLAGIETRAYSEHITIDSNWISDIPIRDDPDCERYTHHHCIYTKGKDILIQNNVLVDPTGGMAIRLDGYKGDSPEGIPGKTGAYTHIIVNNTIRGDDDNHSARLVSFYKSREQYAEFGAYAYIANNLILNVPDGAGFGGFACNSNGTSAISAGLQSTWGDTDPCTYGTDLGNTGHWTEENVVVTNNVTDHTDMMPGCAIDVVNTYANNIINSTNVDVVDEDGPVYDFNLTVGSTDLINQGIATNAPALDYNGNTRTGLPDIGAFEYNVTDATPPAFSSAQIPDPGTTIEISFNENITTSGTGSNWTLEMTNGVVTLSSPSVVGSLITYTLSRVIKSGEVVVNGLDYTQPGNEIEDLANNDLVSFTSGSVINNSQSVDPALQSAIIQPNGNQIKVTFDVDIIADDDGSGWSLVMSGGAVTLSSPSVQGSVITYALSRYVLYNETLTSCGYTQPGSETGIRNTLGIEFPTTAGITVVNNSNSGEPTVEGARGIKFN